MRMNHVKEIREARGLTQRQLAEKLHFAQSLLSDIERGRRDPWPKARRRLARIFKVSESELFPQD